MNSENLKKIKNKLGDDVYQETLEKLKAIQDIANNAKTGIDTYGLDFGSKKDNPIDKLLDASKFYNEQLKDLEESLKDSDSKIAKIENLLSKAEALGDTEYINKYNDTLLEAKNERAQIYQDILTDTQNLKDEINATFAEFAGENLTQDDLRVLFNIPENEFNLGNSSINTQVNELNKQIEEVGNRMVSNFNKGSKAIDLLNRPIIDVSKNMIDTLVDATDKAEDLQGVIATVASTSFSLDDKVVSVTPILPNGKVLSLEELESYFDDLVRQGDDALNSSPIYLGTFDDIESASKYENELHLIQEEYYDLIKAKKQLSETPIDSQDIQQLISSMELTDFGLSQVNQSLQNQIISLQNESAKTENKSRKRSIDLEIQNLEHRQSSLKEYTSAMQSANSQEEKYLLEISNIDAEIHNQRIKINDERSKKELENLHKAHEKTDDIVRLRSELVRLSEAENISYDHKLEILKEISELDMNGYKRKIADIEYQEVFLKKNDYEGMISANQDKLVAAHEQIAYLITQGYSATDDDIRSVYKDIFNYETNIAEAETTKLNKIYKGKQKAAVEKIDAEIKALEKLKTSKDKAIEQLKEELSLLEKKKGNYDSALSAINAVIDKEIEKLNEQKEALQDVTKEQKEHLELLKEELALLEAQKSDRDRAISAVVSVVDDEIHALNEQKKALEELNKEQEKKIELAELEERLRQARENKTVRVFKEDIGWVKLCPAI